MYSRSLNDEDKNKLMQDVEYELYVKDILEKINSADGWENIKIEHNVVLVGKSGATHQIDIYWEFKCGIITHKVAVECKGYNNPISESQIAAFHTVLEDLDGVQGAYASQMGYQRGAILLAKHFSIKLLEIRRPMSLDIGGRLWNIQLDLRAQTIANVQLMVHLAKEDIDQDEAYLLEGIVSPDSVYIIDDDEKKTLQEYLNTFQPINKEKHQCFEKECNNLFYLIGERRIRINKLKYEYDVNIISQEYVISGDNVIKALVRDLSEKKESTVDWSGNIRERKPVE